MTQNDWVNLKSQALTNNIISLIKIRLETVGEKNKKEIKKINN